HQVTNYSVRLYVGRIASLRRRHSQAAGSVDAAVDGRVLDGETGTCFCPCASASARAAGTTRAGHKRGTTMPEKIEEHTVSRVLCPECQRLYSQKEARPLWQCSRENCEEVFVDDDRECPPCGSPSSQLLASFGCEDCLTALEETSDETEGECTDDSD